MAGPDGLRRLANLPKADVRAGPASPMGSARAAIERNFVPFYKAMIRYPGLAREIASGGPDAPGPLRNPYAQEPV